MDAETRLLVIRVGFFVVPVVIAPLVIMGLQPLFSIFLREGTELFADLTLEKRLSRGISRVLARWNVVIFVLSWMAAFGSYLGTGKWTWGALLIVAGVLGALGLTIRQVRNRVGLVGRPALLVGLLAFAGGNLPLFLIVPIALVLR